MADLAADYVQLPFTLDETTIGDGAIEELRATWPDWEPNDGDFEIVLIEKISSLIASLALIAAQMPAAALRAWGTKILGVPYAAGSAAGTTVTFDVVDAAGYVVQAGSQLNIDGYAFSVFQDAYVAPGATAVNGVQVYAAGDPTADANGLTGNLVAPLTLPPYVTGIVVEAPTSGGADPQSDAEYQGAISSEQRLRAKTIVTTRDFEIEALNFDPSIGRAQATTTAARAVTVTVATVDGLVVSGPVKAALAAHYDQFALVNTTFTIADPTYTAVSITWQAKMLPLPAIDPVALVANVNAMLASRLSPGIFGDPAEAPDNWIPENTVRHNVVVAWIAGVSGVDYVESVLINGASGDVVLAGTTPLPTPGVMTGVVD